MRNIMVILKAIAAGALIKYHGAVINLWHILYDVGLLSERMYTRVWTKHVKGARRALLLLIDAQGYTDDKARQMLDRFDTMLRRYEV